MKRALILSGGGLFGAWQAGAWRSLAGRMQPDLIVGASVGSLNGYAIAGGATPQELAEFWLQSATADFSKLPETIRALMERYPLESTSTTPSPDERHSSRESSRLPKGAIGSDYFESTSSTSSPDERHSSRESSRLPKGAIGSDYFESTSSTSSPDERHSSRESSRLPKGAIGSRIRYAVVLTDLLRLKPRIFSGAELTWRHLAASCAIPGVLRPYKIDGRWYFDGGLLNPLPVWAAVELGATHIVALHALPQVPSILLRPFVKGFRRLAGHNPPLPAGIELTLISTGNAIGSMRDTVRWKRENIERWLQMGYSAAQNISLSKCYGGDCLSEPLER